MGAKILFVDDEPNVLAAHQRNLRGQYAMDVSASGTDALRLISVNGPYSVLVSDMNMPGMDGIQLMERAKEVAPETVRIMLTGNADLRTAMNALNRGSIFQFLVKPCSHESMVMALDAGIAQYDLITAEKELLDKTLRGTIRVLVEMLSMSDPVLFGRVQNLRQELRVLAKEVGVSDIWKLDLAAMLSQIGLVTLPAQILAKIRAGAKLSDQESKMVSRVPEISHNLLINIPRLEVVARTVLYKDKHYDGSGFPADDMAGHSIPVGSRILKVLSDLLQYEADGISRQGAFAMMLRREGWYDPKILSDAAKCLGSKERLMEKKPCHPIAVRDLRLGDVIAADIEASDGTLLISEGHQITATLLEKIRNFADLTGVKEPVYVLKHTPTRGRLAA